MSGIVLTVVGLLVAMVVGAPQAAATIRLPSFYVTPNPAAPGQAVTGQVVWDLDRQNYLVGCKNDVDYYVTDPSGTLIASGTLPAGMATTPLETVSSFQIQLAPDAPTGTYSITSQPTRCETEWVDGEFEVAEPTTPLPQIKLDPYSQTHRVGESAAVTATLNDANGQRIPESTIVFGTTGANEHVPGTCTPADCRTDASGSVTFTYQGSAVGDDSVYASTESDPAGDAVAVSWLPSLRGAAYAALGDSYSAGEGTDDYFPETRRDGVNMCHRSPKAYSQLLIADHDFGSTTFRACSGAITDDLYDTNHSGNSNQAGGVESAQLCQENGIEGVTACSDGVVPAIGPDTKVITLTIGGNDAGFSKVLGSCVWASVAHTNVGAPGRLCSARNSVVDPAMRRVLALDGRPGRVVPTPGFYPIHSYSSVLETIHKLAPNAHVFVAGYPRIFQARSIVDCQVGTMTVKVGGRSQSVAVKVAPVDALWIDGLAELMNTSLRTAARKAGSWATYIDASTPFNGHGICSKDPWINPVSGTIVVDALGLAATVNTDERSIHPSKQGQEAYATAFRKAGIMN